MIVVLIAVISRVFVICSAILGVAILGTRVPLEGEYLWNIDVPFFNLFARWDSGFYIDMAREGYVTSAHWAFRPLFPFVLRTLSMIPAAYISFDRSAAIMGFLTNNVFLVIALVQIHKLTLMHFSDRIALLTVFLASFCPAAIFFSAVYTESLYLAILASCFYMLEKEAMLVSGILGFLAGLTRPEGFLTSLVILARGLNIRQLQVGRAGFSFVANRKAIVCSAIAALSFPVFLAYAHLNGGFQLVFSAETGWAKITLDDLILEPHRHKSVGNQLSFFIAVLLMFTSVFSISWFFTSRRRNGIFSDISVESLLPYYLFSMVLAIAFLCQGDVRSMTRFFGTVIPTYWTLALCIERYRWSKPIIIGLFVLLSAVGTMLFVNWYQYI